MICRICRVRGTGRSFHGYRPYPEKVAKCVFKLHIYPSRYRNRTDDLRITRDTVPRSRRTDCTDSTGNRTDSTRRAGTIQGPVPRPLPLRHAALFTVCNVTGGAASRADEHARPSSGPAGNRPLPPMPGLLTCGCRPDSVSAAHHKILAPRLPALYRGALSHARRGRADRGKAGQLRMTLRHEQPVVS